MFRNRINQPPCRYRKKSTPQKKKKKKIIINHFFYITQCYITRREDYTSGVRDDPAILFKFRVVAKNPTPLPSY